MNPHIAKIREEEVGLTGGFKLSSRHLTRLRVGTTILALVILAGSILLGWLIPDKSATAMFTLVATVVGWMVALIAAGAYDDSPSYER